MELLVKDPQKINIICSKYLPKNRRFFIPMPYLSEIPIEDLKEQEELKQDNPYEFNIIVSNLYDINFLNPSVTTLRSLKRSK